MLAFAIISATYDLNDGVVIKLRACFLIDRLYHIHITLYNYYFSTQLTPILVDNHFFSISPPTSEAIHL